MGGKRRCRSCDKPFTRDEAVRIARKVGIDTDVVSVDEIVAGLNEEREHGDITCCDPILTARIAKRHFDEDSHYYEKLARAMKSDFDDEG